MSVSEKRRPRTRDITYIAMFAAVTAVMSQISIPLPMGMPVTLQTLAAALTGYMLGSKRGAAALTVYLLIGLAGLPVFSGLRGGLAVLTGVTGGFIWGFIPMAFLCGMGSTCGRLPVSILTGIAGLAVCHLCGVLQWSMIKGDGLWGSFITVSAPFLLKDSLSVAAGCIMAVTVKKRLGYEI